MDYKYVHYTFYWGIDDGMCLFNIYLDAEEISDDKIIAFGKKIYLETYADDYLNHELVQMVMNDNINDFFPKKDIGFGVKVPTTYRFEMTDIKDNKETARKYGMDHFYYCYYWLKDFND